MRDPAGYELRAENDGDMPTLFGHFAVFNRWTEINSWFEGTSWSASRPELTKTIAEQRTRSALFQHGKDPQIGDKPLGPIRELREEEEGPYYEVPLLDTAYNRELIPGLEGRLWSLLPLRGLRVDEDLAPERSSTTRRRCPSDTVKEARLFEFGPVTFPIRRRRQARAVPGSEFLFDRSLRPAKARELLALAIDLSPQGTTHPPTPTPGLPQNKRAASRDYLERRKSLHGSSDEEELIAKRDQLSRRSRSSVRRSRNPASGWIRTRRTTERLNPAGRDAANLKERDAVEKRIRDLNEEGKTETGASLSAPPGRRTSTTSRASSGRSAIPRWRVRSSRTAPSARSIRRLPHPDADQAREHVERLVQKLDGEDGAFSRYLNQRTPA